MIDYRGISVVVQGPIERTTEKNVTGMVCESIRKTLPGAEIILSTWEGNDTQGLEFDKVIFNNNITANRIYMPWSDDDKLYTINHQLITTLGGIKESTRKYILKLRSDTQLTDDGFIRFYEKYNEYPKDENIDWKVFSHRIVCLPTYNVKRKNGLPFNICDWVFFGKHEDLLDLFDVPLVDTFNLKVRHGEKYPRIEDNFGAEQIIWIECLSKHRSIQIKNAIDKSGSIIDDFEKSLANNFIPISAKLFGVFNIKYGYGGYACDPYLSHGFYTLTEWEHLYNLYGGGDLKIPFRYKDRIIYPLYLFKDYLMKYPIFNKLYRFLVAAVRKGRDKWHD